MEDRFIVSLLLISIIALQPIAIAGSYGTIQIQEKTYSTEGQSKSFMKAPFIRQDQHVRTIKNTPGRPKVHILSSTVNTAHTSAYKPGEILVKFKSGTERKAITQLNSEHHTTILSSHAFDIKRIRVPEGTSVPEMVTKYERSPLVKYAEPNYITHAMMTPNDPGYEYQWHLHSQDEGGINVEPVWDTVTGEGTTVAVLDTGIRQGPDLAETTVINGHDFVNNDDNATDNGKPVGHGTHVAGTIAQSTNNGKGVAGVAFDATLMSVKVMNSTGSGTYSTLIDGINYAVNNGADIISMSLGGSEDSPLLQDAVEYAYNHSVTCVAAAGNKNEPSVSYPAAYDEYVIAVGATRVDKEKAYYSNYGSSLDLVAPGGDLRVNQNDDEYADGVLQQTYNATTGEWKYYFLQGTSMATPHVAGVAALLYSNGTTTPTAINKTLCTTATDLGVSGRDDYYGFGLVNASKALGVNVTGGGEGGGGGGGFEIGIPLLFPLLTTLGVLIITSVVYSLYKNKRK